MTSGRWFGSRCSIGIWRCPLRVRLPYLHWGLSWRAGLVLRRWGSMGFRISGSRLYICGMGCSGCIPYLCTRANMLWLRSYRWRWRCRFVSAASFRGGSCPRRICIFLSGLRWFCIFLSLVRRRCVRPWRIFQGLREYRRWLCPCWLAFRCIVRIVGRCRICSGSFCGVHMKSSWTWGSLQSCLGRRVRHLQNPCSFLGKEGGRLRLVPSPAWSLRLLCRFLCQGRGWLSCLGWLLLPVLPELLWS